MQTMQIESLEQRTLLSAGSVDTSFGKSGQIVGHATVVANGIDAPQITSLAQLSDGKIIGAGLCDGGNALFVTRLDRNGVIDVSFGTMGTTKISFAGFRPGEPLVQVDSSNRIVVGTTLLDSMNLGEFAVARLTANGALDKSFSGDGKATAHFGLPSAGVSAMAIGADSRVVLAGETGDPEVGPQTQRIAIARFTVGGNLDTGFSVDGLQTITPSGKNDFVTSVAVLKDNRVMLAGAYDSQFAAIRLTSAGQIDKAFGNSGIANVQFNPPIAPDAMLIQPDGSTLLAGLINVAPPDNFGQSTFDLDVTKLDAAGRPVMSFGNQGQATFVEKSEEDPGLVKSVSTLSNGDIRLIESDRELRITKNGAVDNSFGDHGTVNFDLDQVSLFGNVQLIAALPRADGTLVQALNQFIGFEESSFNIPIIRTLDINDKVLTTHEFRVNDSISDAAVDSNGKLVVGSDAQGDDLLYRYNSDGSFDSKFGANGRAFVMQANFANGGPTLLPLGDGRVILASPGRDYGAGDSIGIVVSRLQTNGTLDQSFDLGEFSDTTDGKATLLPGGFISASYDSFNSLDEYTILIHPDGSSIDANLPDNGIFGGTFSELALPIGTTGSYVVEGKYLPSDDADQSEAQHVLAKYDATGTLVRSFGNAGILDGPFDLLFAQNDGKLIYKSAGGIKRLNANGSPDSTFGDKGIAAAGYMDFTVDSQNRIIAWKKLSNGDVQLARFTSSGKPDKTFSGDGVTTVHLAVKGDVNLVVTPKNDLVVTSLSRSGQSAKWSAVRILG